MKNIFKKLLIGTIAVMLLLSTVLVAVGCVENNPKPNPDGTTTQKYDPETRPITFAISALDGTFNPFFTTSATDSSVANFTQVGMLGTTNDGQVACGEDEPVVTLDYKITSYDKHNNETENDVDHTTYEFVIKNGMKFSDGVDLTIDDVLFNMYVYLDPMYSGSSTMYSVDIQGLTAYRNNDPSAADDSDSDIEQTFRAKAETRLENLKTWSKGEKELDDDMQKDIDAIREQFKKDLQSDWTSNEGTLESSYKEYRFTEDWESFYYIEGLVSYQTEKNSQGNNVYKKDEEGKYYTSLDDNKDYANSINAAASDEEKIAEYMAKYACDKDTAIYYIKKDYAINFVYEAYASDKAIKNSIQTLLYGMSTGSTILDSWTKEEQSNYYKGNTDSVKSISGITTKKVTSFDGVNKVDLKGEEHDVLCITINGIDPKAIWNFAFTVSPMHYYSDAETLADKDNYPYGVRARDKDFFDDVLNSPEKNALPVGAGAYRASNEQGNASSNPAEVKSSDFWKNKKVYFERNDYFYTMGEGITNAKIRRFIYEEVSENNILNRLTTGEIDYGTPSATPDNKAKALEYSHLAVKEYKTNGYGYVGINPKFVKDLEVRQAIMMALDTSSVIGEYYGGTMAEVINVPMTKLSWAYPDDAERRYAYDSTGLKIEALVESAGYKKVNGIYTKGDEKLKFKFTIAGDTTDHPSYKMFEKARQLLNKHGFDITVGTDVSALKKLATGNLAVWAAAWTSTIDPDLFQIYHKDSKTTNVKNWNYDGILNTDDYPREKAIVNKLSEKIDEARKTNSTEERASTYAEALDLIMDLAIEFPCYQRKDLAVYNKDVIDVSTMNQEKDLKYSSPTERLWELNYN